MPLQQQVDTIQDLRRHVRLPARACILALMLKLQVIRFCTLHEATLSAFRSGEKCALTPLPFEGCVVHVEQERLAKEKGPGRAIREDCHD